MIDGPENFAYRRPAMCNLYSNTMPVEAMRRLFGVALDHDRTGNQPPLPAIFPRAEAPVVRRDFDGNRELVRMHWGFLMPQVSKRTGEPILPKAITNARDDKLSGSAFWRDSFRSRRCLVPATSFCEPKGRKPAVFHWFAVTGEQPRPPFAFAGLWRRFRGRYRDELVETDSYAIVTTSPNEIVRPIHPQRMPVLIAPEDYEAWLTAAPEDALELLRPYPAGRMQIVRAAAGATSDDADPIAAGSGATAAEANR